MARITMRNFDDDLKHRLRVRAAEHGRSMEEEARDILRHVVGLHRVLRNLGEVIQARFAAVGGVDLATAKRGPMRPLSDW